ncbi:chalcone isomerase family protein, partial [Vibrio alginolyticus]
VGDVQVKNVGIIEDERMNDAFLAIWLSPNTEFPKLRKQLIGQVR